MMTGQTAYYVWTGAERALLRFRSLLALGWCLVEVRGCCNEPLSSQTRQEIVQALSDAPMLCAVLLSMHDRCYLRSAFAYAHLNE